ncbi:MAG: hypothetical protein ACFFC6_10490 [Promethearchaeota archaeon]
MIKRGSIILILLLVGAVSIVCISIGTNLLYFQDYNPKEGWHDTIAGVIFSGFNNSGIAACPWIINQTDSSILGANQGFRDYLNEEISQEIQQYSWLTGYDIEYVYTTHLFDYHIYGQLSPNETDVPFDPYYATIRIRINDSDAMNRDQQEYKWDKEVAPTLETIFSEKWYISRFEFMIIKQQ